MTLSTSAVAVCCCSDSRSSFSSRVFSMAMTAWAAKFVDQLDLLICKWSHLTTVKRNRANGSPSCSIGTARSYEYRQVESASLQGVSTKACVGLQRRER